MGLLASFRTHLSRQLSGPSGRAGRVVAALMNRGNRKMNLAALDLSRPSPAGASSSSASAAAATSTSCSSAASMSPRVDPAADMVAALRARRAAEIDAGKLVPEVGAVESLPLADASLDGAVTINTVYFWPALEPGLAELRRTLRPGGILVIGIRDGAVMTNVDPSIFTLRTPQEIRDALATAGFTDTRIESPPDQQVHFIVGR